MKKSIICLMMILISITTLLSNEIELLNNDIAIEKINHNGINGFFITQDYYKEVLKMADENKSLKLEIERLNTIISLDSQQNTINANLNLYLQSEYDKLMKEYNRKVIFNKFLTFSTAFGISIGIAGLMTGIIFYSLSK